MREWPSWEEVIARYGLRLHRAGNSFRGPCPLHGGSNPTAFVITPGKGFYCFNCGAKGGVAAFLERMGDPEALEWARTWRERQIAPIPVRMPKAASPARIEAQAKPVVPIAPLDPRHPEFERRGLRWGTPERIGCGYFGGRGPMHDRIVFPVHDADGVLVGHIGRSIGKKEPRYLCSRGLKKSQLLFNEHRARQADDYELLVVEGPFDVLGALEAGFWRVVSTLGCQVSDAQVARLRTFGRILIAFDGDAAGQAAAAELAERIGTSARIAVLPTPDPANLRPEVLSAALSALPRSRTPIYAPPTPEPPMTTEIICPTCGSPNDTEANHCGFCGVALKMPAPEITPRVARSLPVKEIDGKKYYRDERLRELRSVDDPSDRRPL